MLAVLDDDWGTCRAAAIPLVATRPAANSEKAEAAVDYLNLPLSLALRVGRSRCLR